MQNHVAKPGESDTFRERNRIGVYSARSPGKKENLKKGRVFKKKQFILNRDGIQNLDVPDGQTVHSKAIHITH